MRLASGPMRNLSEAPVLASGWTVKDRWANDSAPALLRDTDDRTQINDHSLEAACANPSAASAGRPSTRGQSLDYKRHGARLASFDATKRDRLVCNIEFVIHYGIDVPSTSRQYFYLDSA